MTAVKQFSREVIRWRGRLWPFTFGPGELVCLYCLLYLLCPGVSQARPHSPAAHRSSSLGARLGPPVLDRWRKPSPRLAAASSSKGRLTYMWEDVSEGMYSLEATAVTLHPVQRKLAYAGADGILYRSTNGGDSWRPIARFRGAGRALLQRINVDPELRRLKDRILEEKLEDLIAEVGEQRAEELRPSLEKEAEEEAERQLANVRRTQQLTGSGRFRRRIHRIVIPPSQPKWVLVATDAGAFRSVDSGKTFKHIYRGRAPGEGDVRVIRVDPKNSKRIWLGTRVGLWATEDGGNQWRRDGGNMRTLEIREIRFDPTRPSRMFIATDRSVFMSKDSGKRFIRLWTFISGTRRITGLTVTNTAKPRLFVATGNGLYRASHNFQNFRRISAAGIGSRDIKYITSIPAAPRWLYVINDQGVFVSQNAGKRFRQLRAGMLTPNVRWIDVRRDDPREIWAATDFGVLRWSKTLAGSITAGQWRRWQRRLGLEPSPWQMARAALRFMNVPRNLGALLSRNSGRGWMPQVAVRFLLALDNDQSKFMLISGQRPISVLEGRAFYFDVQLNWNLGRLIFDDQQMAVVTGTRVLRNLRQLLMNRVIRLYHARRRLMLRQFVTPPQKLHRYVKRQLKIEELTAYLDALTGGHLSRMRRLRGLTKRK